MDTSRKPFLTVDEQIHKYLKRNSYLQKVFAMFNEYAIYRSLYQ